MAEGGVYSEDYRKFIQQPSHNFDDSGYFSVQVIAIALKVWGLDLVPFQSQRQEAQSARADPLLHNAYICNYRDHWLTIRKLGHQWFNLNSLLTGPELLSNTYLSLFIAQLQQEGYSIFVVIGKLPDCAPDRELRLRPATQSEKPRLLSELKPSSASAFASCSSSSAAGQDAELRLPAQLEEEDPALQRTLQASLDNRRAVEEQQLQAALSLSLSSGYEHQQIPDIFEASRSSNTAPVHAQSPACDPIQSSAGEMSEQEMLEVALKMSMEL